MSSTPCFLLALAFHAQISHSYHILDLLHQNKPRSEYLGGWAIGLPGGTACPDFAPNACSYTSGFGGQSCCPVDQWCFGNTISAWYCCPSDNDCSSAVQSVPVCAQEGWNMFSLNWFNEYMCCPAGQKALLTAGGMGEEGLCVPLDQEAPQSLIAQSVAQNGVGPAPIIESTTILAAPSTLQIITTETAPMLPTQPVETQDSFLTIPTPTLTTATTNMPILYASPAPTSTISPTSSITPPNAISSPSPSLSKVVPGSIIGGVCLAALLYYLYNRCFGQNQSSNDWCPSLSFVRNRGNAAGPAPVYGGQTNINHQHTGSTHEARRYGRMQQDEILPFSLDPPNYDEQIREK